MKFLDDNTEEDDVDDKFNNQPTTIKHNLEYLIKKFTKEPVELENRKELEENKEVKTVLNKLYENEIKDKLKKSEKETS
jgi:molybdate-binding protein